MRVDERARRLVMGKVVPVPTKIIPKMISILVSLGLAGCMSAATTRNVGSRVDVSSSKSVDTVTACIQEKWSGIVDGVTTNPYQGGKNIRAANEAGVLVQADVMPSGTGAIVAMTTPYGAQVHNFEPSVRACAA